MSSVSTPHAYLLGFTWSWQAVLLWYVIPSRFRWWYVSSDLDRSHKILLRYHSSPDIKSQVLCER
jgi:hypothetical protein